eukprot:7017208-Prymnesium_polylepis.1
MSALAVDGKHDAKAESVGGHRHVPVSSDKSSVARRGRPCQSRPVESAVRAESGRGLARRRRVRLAQGDRCRHGARGVDPSSLRVGRSVRDNRSSVEVRSAGVR